MNLLPDSRNLANFESIRLQILVKCMKCIFACVCLHIHLVLSLLMVWKFMTSNGSFEGRSMVLNTTYQICLQNVETDYLDVFAKCW